MRPGRAARWLAPVLLLGALGALACAADAPPLPPELEGLRSEYAALAEHRALAIAGELRRNQWVAGASGGHATRAEAERGALRECALRRAARRIVEPCRLYWTGEFGSATRGR